MDRKRELQARYLSELLKVGFTEDQAKEIVAEAADRLGADVDAPRQYIPLPKPKPQPAVGEVGFPRPGSQERAVQLLTRREHKYGRRRYQTWNRIKDARDLTSLAPGRNAMEVMKELLAQDMKALEFTPEDIEYIVGATH
jgi:hypothetical protein